MRKSFMAGPFSLPPFVTQTPPATRWLVGALTALSLVHVVYRYAFELGGHTDEPWLLVVPGASYWFPWSFLTAGFVETNIFSFAISVLSLVLSGRYLERVWGQLELLKFCAVVIVASNIIAIFVNVLEFYVLGSESFLYGMSYSGQTALQTGFLVAFTQLIPEHQVQLFRFLKVRVKSLPMAYVTLSNILCIVGFQSPWILIQFGWLVSWFYLRFVKWTPAGDIAGEGGYRGDRSETFAFVNWFPPFLHKPVGLLSNTLFALAVKFKVLQPWGAPVGDLESGFVSSRAEAERRRALALKALDQRLATKPSSSAAASTSASASAAPAASAAFPAEAAPSAGAAAAPEVEEKGKEEVVQDLGGKA